MDDVTQIRVGKHTTGIIGLKAALEEAAAGCKGMTDVQIGKVLMDDLSRRNYFESGFEQLYSQALVREYKRHIGESITEASGQGATIKVLGPGCAQCDRLEREVMTVLSENQISAEFEHVRDLAEIARLGVMRTPALLINGVAKVLGSVPSRKTLEAWILEAVHTSENHQIER